MISVDGLNIGDPIEVVHRHRGNFMGYFAGADENWLHVYRDGHAVRRGRTDPYPREDVLSIILMERQTPAGEVNVLSCSDVEW